MLLTASLNRTEIKVNRIHQKQQYFSKCLLVVSEFYLASTTAYNFLIHLHRGNLLRQPVTQPKLTLQYLLPC